jgi:hypothetical protein
MLHLVVAYLSGQNPDLSSQKGSLFRSPNYRFTVRRRESGDEKRKNKKGGAAALLPQFCSVKSAQSNPQRITDASAHAPSAQSSRQSTDPGR